MADDPNKKAPQIEKEGENQIHNQEQIRENQINDLSKGFEQNPNIESMPGQPSPEQWQRPEMGDANIAQKEKTDEFRPEIAQPGQTRAQTQAQGDDDDPLNKLTASQDPRVIKMVRKAIKGNKIAIIKDAKKKFNKEPRLLDEFHDALMEADQIDN